MGHRAGYSGRGIVKIEDNGAAHGLERPHGYNNYQGNHQAVFDCRRALFTGKYFSEKFAVHNFTPMPE